MLTDRRSPRGVVGPDACKPGILLVGHGTREPRGVADFMAVGKQVEAQLCGTVVAPCFLELSEPAIPEGIHRLLATGTHQIIVAPLLLFAAAHARRDIPNAVADALHGIPEVTWIQSPHLGGHPAILQQSQERFREAILGRPPVGKEQTLLLFVGRGSTDEGAIREAHAFAASAPQAASVAKTIVCFYAMANPRLDKTLDQVATAGYRRVVVQAHLLFEGQIAERMRGLVRAAAEKHPEVEWLVTAPLGPTERVAEAVVGRISNPSCPA